MALPLQPPTKTTLAKYGLSLEDWYVLLAATDGECPVCHKRFTQNRRPVIDHDHRTGHARGLLCSPCNTAVGYFHDNAAWFANAASYLAEPTAERALDGPRLHVNAPPQEAQV